MNSTIKHDVAFFDFLRGWSAILVFLHHASILGGGPKLFNGRLGLEAVNAFMLASGFLIYYQCATSKAYDQLKSSAGIWNFYIRRFFRIAPAYYVALAAALLLATYLGHARDQIAEILPSAGTAGDRYFIKDYFTSALVHVSFVFGVLPQYSYSTPLPDWSLGLEMQFYVVFPLLYLLYRRNFMVCFIGSLLLMLLIGAAAGRIGIHFPMPSFLPLKFNNFAAGIALAYCYLNPTISFRKRIFLVAATILFLVVGNHSWVMPAVFLFAFWFLTRPTGQAGAAAFFNRVFTHGSSKFLADISYSLYILHLLLMLPFFALVLKYGCCSSSVWLFACVILLTVTTLVAYVSYRLVEIPGISVGKRLLKHTELK